MGESQAFKGFHSFRLFIGFSHPSNRIIATYFHIVLNYTTDALFRILFGEYNVVVSHDDLHYIWQYSFELEKVENNCPMLEGASIWLVESE